jgi:hypothetical protein
MSDLKPVSKPNFLLEGRGAQIVIVILLAIIVAMLKPWGSGSDGPSAVLPAATALPSPSSSPIPTRDIGDGVSRPYDPLIFGDKEMQAAWGVWPAGYLVTFGFAMRADPTARPSADATASGQPVSSDAADIPAWPAGIDLPVGNHLLLIGINTPLDYHVRTARLTRLGPDAAGTDVPLIRPTSPWPLHFTVIGVDGGHGADRPAFWLPGSYRLDLVIDPGPIERSIEVTVASGPVILPGSSIPTAAAASPGS